MHMRHIALLVIAIVFSWVLWTIVNLEVYAQLSGKALVFEILEDFAEQVIETTILLELFTSGESSSPSGTLPIT